MKTIIWDVDDVLNDLMREWFEGKWLPENAGCVLDYTDLLRNPPEAILGIARAEYLRSLDDFRLASFSRLKPVPEALAWFEKHGSCHRHLALTSVPLNAAPLSAEWVSRHFGRWIRSFNFVPSPRDSDVASPVFDRTKQDFLRWLNLSDTVVVDDSESNITGARELGIPGVLVPRPWNQGRGTIPQALEHLDSLLQD
jgi:hypothetical protein